jgi:hypothetical protein
MLDNALAETIKSRAGGAPGVRAGADSHAVGKVMAFGHG